MRVFQVLLWILGGLFFILVAGIVAFWLVGPTVDTTGFRPVDTSTLPLQTITVPEGFTITEYARVDNARSIALGPEGVLFIGSRNAGKVYAVFDDNMDYVADRIITVDHDLFMPNGVAYRDGDLYVAEVNTIRRYPHILAHPDDAHGATIFTGYPDDRHHGWKFIRFGPDGLLYIPVGAPCNVCDEVEPYSTITRMNVTAQERSYEIFARGVRNTVGFDWDEQGRLWFTDNGRDLMGDNVPLDELNRVDELGEHFGFPFCHQGDVQDPEFTGRGCDEFTAPVQNLGPHVAALGIRFYDGQMFPSEYQDQIFIAEHGSWNRREPIGYRVSLVRRDGDQTSYETFASGWLSDGEAWGRPVDVQVLWDGSLLVSDDKAGALYRIAYG